jgi:AcrR family transcriptional regulator
MAARALSPSRPGGRSARVRASVHRAVEELLVDGTAESLTIPIIASRAGVHPTTIYRRWGTLAELVADAASSRFSGDIVVPDTGTLREDLRRWLTDVATDLNDPDVLALMRATVGVAGAHGRSACIVDRHAQLQAMLEQARARGERAPDVERAAEALLGPLYYRALFTAQQGEPEWVHTLVDALLDSSLLAA